MISEIRGSWQMPPLEVQTSQQEPPKAPLSGSGWSWFGGKSNFIEGY